MKSLLRSLFVADAGDSDQLILRNYQLFNGSGLGFDVPEYNSIWAFIQEFVRAHSHVPNLTTIRSHFEHAKEDTVLDQLRHLEGLPARTKGDFQRVLEDKANDRRQRLWAETLKEGSVITMTGMEVTEGREKKILKGPVQSARYVVEKAHDIVAPTIGGRLSGEVTKDGVAVKAEYDLVESDPLAGIGQFAFLDQMDRALAGAKRHELWIHAAFTGGMKCITGGCKVTDLNTGERVTAKDLYRAGNAPLVHSFDEQAGRMTTAQASSLVAQGIRPIFKVATKTGRQTRVSGNHPFLCPKGWVAAENLKLGDWVAVPAALPGSDIPSPYGDDEIALVGYLLGDGTIGGDLAFTNSNEEIQKDFISRLQRLGYTEASGKYSTAATYRYTCPDTVRVSRSTGEGNHPWRSPLRKLLDNLGLWGCRATTKHVPDKLWAMSDDQAWLLLSALWSTDGCVGIEPAKQRRKARAVVWYGSRSEQLARDVQALLNRVGVPATVSRGSVKYRGSCRPFWTTLVTTNDGKRKFLTKTQIIGKQESVVAALKAVPLNVDTDWFPSEFLNEVPDQVRFRTQQGGWYYAKWAKRKTSVLRDTVKRFAEAADDPRLGLYAAADVRWEQVVAVDPDGEEEAYDLSVPATGNFVVDGFITHNSTFMLNWAYNQAVIYRHNVLIFSLEMPYNQCRRILYAIHSMHPKFREIRMQLGLQQDVESDVGLPYGNIRDGKLHEWHPNAKRFYFDFVIPDFNGEDVVKHPYLKCDYAKIHIEVADPDKDDFTMHDLRSMAEVIYSKDPFSMIFVDHVGLMSPRNRHSSTTESLNEVIRDLKKLALGFNRGQGMAVVGLFQISREGYKSALKQREKTGKAGYNLTHLSYANEAERSGDIVTSTWIDDELKDQNRVQFNCLKSRDQKPFDPFIARVEWPCRRLLSCFDLAMTPEQNAEMGAKIDAATKELEDP